MSNVSYFVYSVIFRMHRYSLHVSCVPTPVFYAKPHSDFAVFIIISTYRNLNSCSTSPLIPVCYTRVRLYNVHADNWNFFPVSLRVSLNVQCSVVRVVVSITEPEGTYPIDHNSLVVDTHELGLTCNRECGAFVR
jgi:hypothetical protein